MGNFLQPIVFERLDQVGCGYQNAHGSRHTHTYTLSLLLATPGCWILFLFPWVLCEFPFNKEPLIVPYLELAWDYFTCIPPIWHVPLH